MKKFFFLTFPLCLLFTETNAQSNYIDSLQQLIVSGKDDTLKVQRLIDIGFHYLYANSKPDSGLAYAGQALILSQKINYPIGEAASYDILGQILCQLGDYVGALKAGFNALNLAQSLNDYDCVTWALDFLGANYRDQGDYNRALVYLFKSYNMVYALPDNTNICMANLCWSKNDLLAIQY